MSTYDIPGASVYGSAVELAKKRYQTRLADLNKQRQSTLRTAGFSANVDDKTGLLTNQRIDPYSKYGQLQQMNRGQSFRHDELMGMNVQRGLSSRGGLGAQNLSNLRYDFGKEDATFGSNLTDMLAGYTRQQEDEMQGLNEALWQAQQAAAQAAIGAGDYGFPGGGDGPNDVYPLDYPNVPPTQAQAPPRPAPSRPVASAPVVRRPPVVRNFGGALGGALIAQNQQKKKQPAYAGDAFMRALRNR